MNTDDFQHLYLWITAESKLYENALTRLASEKILSVYQIHLSQWQIIYFSNCSGFFDILNTEFKHFKRILIEKYIRIQNEKQAKNQQQHQIEQNFARARLNAWLEIEASIVQKMSDKLQNTHRYTLYDLHLTTLRMMDEIPNEKNPQDVFDSIYWRIKALSKRGFH